MVTKTTKEILWDLCGPLDCKIEGLRACRIHGKAHLKAALELQDSGIAKLFQVGKEHPAQFVVLVRDAAQATGLKDWKETFIMPDLRLIET
jgi:hypothetical protein